MSTSSRDVTTAAASSSRAAEAVSTSNSAPSKYIPPHLRNKPASASSTNSASTPTNRRDDVEAKGPGRFTSSLSRDRDSRDTRDSRDSHSSHRDREGGSSFGARDIRKDEPVSERFQRDREESSGGGSTRFARDDVRGGFGGKNRQPALDQRDARLEAELFGEVKKGIDFKNYEDIPVETSGHQVPEPIDSFNALELHEVIRSNVQLSGYDRPTPVQRYGIPISLARRDLMACAQTGSGKTAAFLLPTVQLILATGVHLNPPPAPTGGSRMRSRCFPAALVLAPTRELATQIYNEARKFCYRSGIRPVVVYGGQDIREQLRQIERGCDLVIATPGRLVDFLERGRMSMANIHFLVFDEADRMLDMGFEPQIRQIVEQSDMPANQRQTLMFSATFPKEIQRLAQDFLYDYIFLAVGRVGSTTDFITQKVEYAGGREQEKLDRLMQILSTCEGLTLIFVETKRGADLLESTLSREGIDATSIHGDRTQDEREHALKMFRCGRCPVLVATDVASRGLDIPDVRCVINYDLPSNIDDYVHRIGRTGRAGQKGTAIAFVSEKNKPILRELFELMKENKQELPSWFENLTFSTSYGSGGGSSYGRSRGGGGRSGGGGGGGRFASRDYRTEDASWGGANKHSNAGGGGGRQGGGGGHSGGGGGGGHSGGGHSGGGSGGFSQGPPRFGNRGGSYQDSW